MRSPEAKRPWGAWYRFWLGPCPTPWRGRMTEYDMERSPGEVCTDHYHMKPLTTEELIEMYGRRAA